MGIFKSYDIRGVYGTEWDAATACAIGRSLPRLLGARDIAVGRDARLSSDEILRELSRGITEAGCNVADLGLCDTPAVYFSTAFYGFDGSVMITASHNPPEYNGMKISGKMALPVGYDSGLAALEAMVAAGAGKSARTDPAGSGSVRALDIRADYISHLRRFQPQLGGMKVVIDCSNGTVGVFLRDALSGAGGRVTVMFEEPDGRFPNHAPNPLVEANLSALKGRVAELGADIGICFDGDADRVMFVDETGRFVSPDLLIGLIGTYYFTHHPERMTGGSPAVTYDVRTSRGVVEFLQNLGAKPTICKVGHSHAKKLLRETDGIFGGELAGHYYFRENYFCDSGLIAAQVVLSVVSRERKPLSKLIEALRKYRSSGEINFTVPNGPEIVRRVQADYADGQLTDIDGIRLDFPTWWFNLRVSNTEPLLRLVVEASTEEELAKRRQVLVEKVQAYSSALPRAGGR